MGVVGVTLVKNRSILINERINIQSEGIIYIGDVDWVGSGNDIYLAVDDATLQKVIISYLSAGAIEADANGGIINSSSDRRLKKNIIKIDNALEKVTKLSGVYFNWKTKEEGNTYNVQNEARKMGFIAQEVEKVAPEVITKLKVPQGEKNNPNSILYKKDFFKGIREGDMTALLVEAIKEQQVQIDKLNNIVDKLTSKQD